MTMMVNWKKLSVKFNRNEIAFKGYYTLQMNTLHTVPVVDNVSVI